MNWPTRPRFKKKRVFYFLIPDPKRRFFTYKLLPFSSCPFKAGDINEVPNKSISLVSIHATILSIIVAFTSAYFIYNHQLIRQVELHAMQEAGKINDLYFPQISILPTKKDFDFPSTIEKVRIALVRVNLLATKDIVRSAIDHFGIPLEPTERAKEMVALINIIAHSYPFPLAIKKTEGGWIQGGRQPLQFDDVKSVQNWVADVQSMQRPISSLYAALKLSGYPGWTIPPDRLYEKLGFISDPDIILKTFLDYTAHAITIANNTSYLLIKAQKMRALYLPKWKLAMILFITGIIFMCSVALPLLYENVPRCFYAQVPLIYYISVFCAVCFEILMP